LLGFAQAALAPTSVTVQLRWHHAFQFAGYYAAVEKGYYKEAGLAVQLKDARPGLDVVDEVVSGRADFGIGNSGLLIDRLVWPSVYWISGALTRIGLIPVRLLVPEIAPAKAQSAFDYTGALLLFAAVQISMLVHGLLQGERPDRAQVLGFALALGGLLVLLLPGASAPDLKGALLMLLAGVAWGFYSLLGRGSREPLAASSGNFLRTLPFVAVLLLAYWPELQGNGLGVLYAVLSGALTSGLGYFIWYSALPGLSAFQAASVQLSVPILAALAGSLLLAEALSLRLLLAALAVLGGIGLILRARVSKV